MDDTLSTSTNGFQPCETYNYAFFELIRDHSLPRGLDAKQFLPMLDALMKHAKHTKFMKPFDDFTKAVILRQCGFEPAENMSPREYEKAAEKALNDLETRHRFVFSVWPRPDAMPQKEYDALEMKPYQYITPDNSIPGKMAPNGVELWGETLLDFYATQRIPGLSNLRTFSCASKLLRWCEANGEAEGTTWNGKEVPAKTCIESAREEGDPEVVEVYDVGKLVKESELRIRLELATEEIFSNIEMEDKSGQSSGYISSSGWTLDARPPSLFDPSAYPPRWKELRRFAVKGPAPFWDLPNLEHYIPQHLLPKKLVVHDPFKLLHAVHNKRKSDATWAKTIAANGDHTHTYRLNLSEAADERRKQDMEEIDKEQEKAKETLARFLEKPHSSTNPKPPGIVYHDHGILRGAMPPAVYIVLPPRPTPVTPDEAHLYLSGSHFLGSGNHSFVYHAEWEVPRSLLVQDELCTQCVMEDAEAVLKEQDGEDGELKDPRWKEMSGDVVISDPPPPTIMTIGGYDKLKTETYELPPRSHHSKEPSPIYTGPYRVIQSRCQWQNLERGPYCKHLEGEFHPLTTRVRVAAKLSIQHDDHLAIEARNYQKFPKHFFQHWSGYNILRPLHDPTPIGPLVPQFYGYYVPEEAEEDQAEKEKERGDSDSSGRTRSNGEKSYLSPILLMEHCGQDIVSNKLSIDDKHECVALCLRLHHAEWVHNSLYQRNILRKPGPLSAHPRDRSENTQKRGGYGIDWSFRFIDFGRTEFVGDEPGTGIIGSLDREHQKIRAWFDGFRDLDS